MTYTTFKETLLTELTGHFPPDTKIHIHSIPRNNHVTVDGLTILESGYNIAPTIYIQEYYGHLKKGASFPTVYKEILDTYYKYRPQENIDPALFCDVENIQHHIVYKLINLKENRDLLQQIPHIPFLDLAMVFYCLLTSGPEGTATILIRNSHLKLWNIDLSQLYNSAKLNTPRLLPPRIEKLSSLLTDLLSGEDDGDLKPFSCPIYVLTNSQRFLGAACMLYDYVLEEFARKMESDLYIIPSSIHEVLLIPTSVGMTMDEFNQTIQEVNRTQLEPEEILSDHLYYYTREKHKITL